MAKWGNIETKKEIPTEEAVIRVIKRCSEEILNNKRSGSSGRSLAIELLEMLSRIKVSTK